MNYMVRIDAGEYISRLDQLLRKYATDDEFQKFEKSEHRQAILESDAEILADYRKFKSKLREVRDKIEEVKANGLLVDTGFSKDALDNLFKQLEMALEDEYARIRSDFETE